MSLQPALGEKNPPLAPKAVLLNTFFSVQNGLRTEVCCSIVDEFNLQAPIHSILN